MHRKWIQGTPSSVNSSHVSSAGRLGILLARARLAIGLLLKGDWEALFGAFARRLWSTDKDAGLCLYLDRVVPQDASHLGLRLREFQPSDLDTVFSTTGPHLDRIGKEWRALRRSRELKAGIPTCYIAETKEGLPCYVEWVFTHRENAAMKRLYGDEFPPLSPDEAMVERVYTLEGFRGKGVMGEVLRQTVDRLKAQGCRKLITFVSPANKAAMKAFQKAGFVPYLRRTERWRCFIRVYSFAPVAGPE